MILFSCAKAGTHGDKGWAESAYGCSKIGVTLMSFAHQREFDKDSREDIVLNAVSQFLVHLYNSLTEHSSDLHTVLLLQLRVPWLK